MRREVYSPCLCCRDSGRDLVNRLYKLAYPCLCAPEGEKGLGGRKNSPHSDHSSCSLKPFPVGIMRGSLAHTVFN